MGPRGLVTGCIFLGAAQDGQTIISTMQGNENIITNNLISPPITTAGTTQRLFTLGADDIFSDNVIWEDGIGGQAGAVIVVTAETEGLNVSNNLFMYTWAPQPGGSLTGIDCGAAGDSARILNNCFTNTSHQQFPGAWIPVINAGIGLYAFGNKGYGIRGSGLLIPEADNEVALGSRAKAFKEVFTYLATIKGNLDHDGSNIGFYGTAPVGQQTVTGSRGGNAALASLLTALAASGIIVDSTTA